MTRAFHKFWFKISAIVIAGFGPFLTLATVPAWNEPARWGLDLLTWPLDGFPDYGSEEIRFVSALTGGFLIGWGVMVWCLSVWVYDHAPEQVRKALLTGACAWFVFDSTGSILSGHTSNAIFNVLVLLMVIGPMWVPAREDVQSEGKT